MNYSKLINGFTKELCQYCQYKRFDTTMKRLAFIGLLPFWIVAFLLIGVLHVYSFIFNGLSASVEYLEIWIKEFNKDVSKGIAEAVVYLIALPFIWFFRCITWNA
jgi:hypothetical protein